jgi:hypothetical protein
VFGAIGGIGIIRWCSPHKRHRIIGIIPRHRHVATAWRYGTPDALRALGRGDIVDGTVISDGEVKRLVCQYLVHL